MFDKAPAGFYNYRPNGFAYENDNTYTLYSFAKHCSSLFFKLLRFLFNEIECKSWLDKCF